MTMVCLPSSTVIHSGYSHSHGFTTLDCDIQGELEQFVFLTVEVSGVNFEIIAKARKQRHPGKRAAAS